MTLQRTILVVANVAGASEDCDHLATALTAHVGTEPTTFRLVVTATPFAGGREIASGYLSDAITRLKESGLTADGSVGDSDPLIAVNEAWDPALYDEIIISTLPAGPSKWLHAALPERVAKLTGALVTHHVRDPAKPVVETEVTAINERGPLIPRSPLVPLSVLRWGARRS